MVLAGGDERQSDLVIIAIPQHPDITSQLDRSAGLYAAVLIGCRDHASSLDPEVLQLLYGLTNAEARLAILLSTGKSLQQCSEASGLSLNTERSYLKLIFQKTATRRQAELYHCCGRFRWPACLLLPADSRLKYRLWLLRGLTDSVSL